jgi:hypothetical protein
MAINPIENGWRLKLASPWEVGIIEIFPLLYRVQTNAMTVYYCNACYHSSFFGLYEKLV